MALPGTRNSGLDRTSKEADGEAVFLSCTIVSFILHIELDHLRTIFLIRGTIPLGPVPRWTMILCPLDTWAIARMAAFRLDRSRPGVLSSND
jgi:hypothetical protein